MAWLKLPFAVITFLISLVLAAMAYADLTNPAWGPVRQFLSTVSPVLTGFLGFWVAADASRKQKLADDYLADLADLTSEHVRLYYRICRIVKEQHSLEIPTGFIRENELHNDLRTLRRARLIAGTEGSRFKAGRRFVIARWTDRLRGLGLKTINGESWRDIELEVQKEETYAILGHIEQLARIPCRTKR